MAFDVKDVQLERRRKTAPFLIWTQMSANGILNRGEEY